MIVKKLRESRHWSQEQLAIMSGLSIRTIQRVESGQSTSLETLKSLASVFETDISKLTEEITVIDKDSQSWKNLPWWVRANYLGIGSRKTYFIIEVSFLIVGLLFMFSATTISFAPACFVGAYASCATIRYADNKGLWDF
ncbi:helix-turn-helix domain-containing protein [Aliikangiella sp. IMCC44653]